MHQGFFMPIFPRCTVGAGHARPCRVGRHPSPDNGRVRRPRRPAGQPPPSRKNVGRPVLWPPRRGQAPPYKSMDKGTPTAYVRAGHARPIHRRGVFNRAIMAHGPGAVFPYLAPLKTHVLKLHFKLHPCKIRADVLQSHSIPF